MFFRVFLVGFTLANSGWRWGVTKPFYPTKSGERIQIVEWEVDGAIS